MTLHALRMPDEEPWPDDPGWDQAGEELATDAQAGPDHTTHQDLASWVAPIEWAAFWATETVEQDWLIEPIVPAGRQVAIYSRAKAGKSLFTLDAVAALATGRPVLGQRPSEPVHVVYIDQEMTPDDLRERLTDLGYGPADDLGRLHYYQLVSLPALDTELGGQVLEAIAAHHGAPA